MYYTTKDFMLVRQIPQNFVQLKASVGCRKPTNYSSFHFCPTSSSIFTYDHIMSKISRKCSVDTWYLFMQVGSIFYSYWTKKWLRSKVKLNIYIPIIYLWNLYQTKFYDTSVFKSHPIFWFIWICSPLSLKVEPKKTF